MTPHQTLSQRVAALRDRLQEAEPRSGSKSPRPQHPDLQALRQHIGQVKTKTERLEARLPELSTSASPTEELPSLPRQLTWRARRLLLQGRELLEQLKGLTDLFAIPEAGADPLAEIYRQTLAMAELVIRGVAAFPEPAGEQQRLCDGVAATLEMIAARTTGLQSVVERRRVQNQRVDSLAQWFSALVQGQSMPVAPLRELAETIAKESHPLATLRFAPCGPDTPPRWAAAHSINRAYVLARLVHRDTEWRNRGGDAILASLLCDVGMAGVSPAILRQRDSLSDVQRRRIEAHVGSGCEAVNRLVPAEGWLTDMVRAHHERQDGTGYPAGVAGAAIPHLAQLIAVCDVYTALSTERPHRPALSPRAALTETLLEAEKGRLNTGLAEYLLELSFYPVGTIVELSDGSIAIVIAPNPVGGDLCAPARPMVQVLRDETGQPPASPEYVNLAHGEGRHIVRSLSSGESRQLLGSTCWEVL